jgi:hypothetical protein
MVSPCQFWDSSPKLNASGNRFRLRQSVVSESGFLDGLCVGFSPPAFRVVQGVANPPQDGTFHVPEKCQGILVLLKGRLTVRQESGLVQRESADGQGLRCWWVRSVAHATLRLRAWGVRR